MWSGNTDDKKIVSYFFSGCLDREKMNKQIWNVKKKFLPMLEDVSMYNNIRKKKEKEKKSQNQWHESRSKKAYRKKPAFYFAIIRF